VRTQLHFYIILFFIGLHYTTSISANLLKNPDFEKFSISGLATEWESNAWGMNKPIQKYNIESRRDFVFSSTTSQKISVNHINNGAGAIFKQSFVFRAGRIYEFRCMIRSNKKDVKIKTLFRKIKSHYDVGAAKTYVINNTWKEVIMYGGFSKDIKGFVGLYFRPGDSVTVWIDDASLLDVTDSVIKEIITDKSIHNGEIKKNLFGMTINKLGRHNIFPNINAGLYRLWSTGTDWDALEPSKEQWVWDNKLEPKIPDRLSYYIRHIKKHSNAEIMYTFGYWMKANRSSWLNQRRFNLSDWTQYIKKISARNEKKDKENLTGYNGAIRYWEIWNEVNIKFFYNRGKNEINELVELSKKARDILKSDNKNNVILSPNISNLGLDYMDDFLFSGGKDTFDILSAHNYISNGNPELSIPFYIALKDLMAHYGINKKPIWITEGAVISVDKNISAKFSRAMVARQYLLMLVLGIKNYTWYFWEGALNLNPILLSKKLTNPDSYTIGKGYWEKLEPGGVAYKNLTKWVVGTSIVSIKHSPENSRWELKLKKDDEFRLIVWQEHGVSHYTIPKNLRKLTLNTLSGKTTPFKVNQLNISEEPVMLTYKADKIMVTH